MSLTPISLLESARRYFSWTRRTWCLESSNETFLGSGGRNESNTHQFIRINLKKFSHEFDVHDVYKVGIKRFCAQEAEMSQTANSSPNRREENFSWTWRTSCLESRNQTFLAQEAEMSVTPIRSLEWVEKIFHAFDVHGVCKVGIKRIWAEEAEMSQTANSSLESAGRKFFMNSTYIMSRK